MKTKTKNILTILFPSIYLLMGLIILILPIFEINEPAISLYSFLGIYAILRLVQFIFLRATKDYEYLYTFIGTILVFSSFFWLNDISSAKNLGLVIITWVSLMCIIKLIKIDYYDDRDNGMLYIKIVSSALFLIIGMITCLNLLFVAKVQMLVIGFFFVINGILILGEDSIRILISNKKTNIK